MRISDWSSDVCSSDLLAAGYRGYSGNPGKPSEPGLTADARSLLDWAAAEGYGRERLVYYGESLGTAVAVKIASERPPSALVLEAPPSSIADVAQAHYWYLPVRLLIRDPWDRSEEHTSELQSLMRISYAVFCLKKKNNNNPQIQI